MWWQSWAGHRGGARRTNTNSTNHISVFQRIILHIDTFTQTDFSSPESCSFASANRLGHMKGSFITTKMASWRPRLTSHWAPSCWSLWQKPATPPWAGRTALTRSKRSGRGGREARARRACRPRRGGPARRRGPLCRKQLDQVDLKEAIRVDDGGRPSVRGRPTAKRCYLVDRALLALL